MQMCHTYLLNFTQWIIYCPLVYILLIFKLFSLHKRFVATYESGSLRKFQEGRTDTIRSCSVATAAYCAAMLDSNMSTRDRAKLLRDAVWAHRKYTDDVHTRSWNLFNTWFTICTSAKFVWQVVNGLGIDRHLFGLKMIAKENSIDIPALFTDQTFHTGGHWVISTSQVHELSLYDQCHGNTTYAAMVT